MEFHSKSCISLDSNGAFVLGSLSNFKIHFADDFSVIVVNTSKFLLSVTTESIDRKGSVMKIVGVS